jgi:hypothetical protein
MEVFMPIYRRASYSGESLVLENKSIRLELHKRLTGWGWGEIYTPDGNCMAILEHLGEILLRDQEIPMRLEADEFLRESTPQGERLVFQVRSLIVKEKLKGTSFEPWLNYPLEKHCLMGEVSILLPPNQAVIHLSYRFIAQANQYARYVRGPWIKAGEASFGATRADAIFPGIEWLLDDEWSSGTDWFKDPWAQRSIPHPNKAAAPLLAVSHAGWGLGLAWDFNQPATGWFNYRRCRPQPVFASPNFIDRQNNHLMGLMVPDVDVESHENQVYMEPPLELHLLQEITFDAEVFLVPGDSLDVMVDWIKRHGLPTVPQPRWPLPEALDRIASAYTGHLWHAGKGFGTEQTKHSAGPYEPGFAKAYITRNPASPLARDLQTKVDWCLAQPGIRHPKPTSEDLLRKGRELISAQRPDGSFPFDPQGRHYRKDDFVVASTFIEPMGHAQDTALDITILPALELLEIAAQTGEANFLSAARRALDYCLPMRRPEGGDFWETPLHSPNLLAAGHAAVAYMLGYRAFNDDRYRAKAVHWIRSLLPFTHLWEPSSGAVKMLYNTKPCLCSSDWYFANWVRDHVQWEVLETFTLSIRHRLRWAEIDPEIDWDVYHKGITVAVMRWMLDHTDDTWRPHNIPSSLPLYRAGKLDMCFADTHNTTSGNYGGATIMPDAVASNILAILAREELS